MKQIRKITLNEALRLKPSEHSPNLSLYVNHTEDLVEKITEALELFKKNTEDKKRYMSTLKKLEELTSIQDYNSITFPAVFFINSQMISALEIPLVLKPICVVATSFHLKPILKWKQREQLFLCAKFNKKSVNLYFGSLSHFINYETLEYSEYVNRSELWETIDRMVTRTVYGEMRVPFILSGLQSYLQGYKENSKYGSIIEETIEEGRSLLHDEDVHRAAIQVLEPYLEQKEEIAIKRFLRAQKEKKTLSNLESLILQAYKGKVKHLFIREDIELWGDLKPKNDFFSYSLYQKSIYDDDLLDDLAELVLKYNGQVTVLPKERMPQESICCGILSTPKNKYSTCKIPQAEIPQTREIA